MGWLTDRIMRRRETRRDDPSWSTLPAAFGHGVMGPAAPEQLAAVAACINFISSNVASLPPLLYAVDTAGRRTENMTHPVNRVLQRPNNVQTWCEFAELMIGSVLSAGNALALLDHDLSGRLVSLTPVPWGMVTPYIGQTGAMVYEVHWPGRPAGRYLGSEVLHLRDRGHNAYVGVSRLHRAAETIRHAHAAELAANKTFERSGRPSGAFKMSRGMGKDVQTRFMEHIADEVAGAFNTGRVMLLQDGVDWISFDHASARDAELLASRQWSVVDIARLFGIPPLLVGDYQFARGPVATEAQTLFANTTLRHWVVKFEAALNAAVFGATTGATFCIGLDMSAMMRADPAQHVASDNVLLSHGIVTPNEVREAWGYSPSAASGMDEPRQSPQTGGPQLTGTQPGGMAGAPP